MEVPEIERLREKARHDEAQALYHAEQKGVQKGIQEGLQKGASARSIEIAQRLLKRGRPIEEIMEDTGLTYQEVGHLRTNI